MWIGYFCLLFCHRSGGQDFENREQAKKVLAKAAKLVESNYFDKKVAARVAKVLSAKETQDRYAGVKQKPELARLLSKQLLELTSDKHLTVQWAGEKQRTESDAEAKARRERDRRMANSGIRKIEILKGNVAYLEITSFFRRNEVKEKYKHAAGMVADADAIIIDLRNNGGGSPEGVVELAGYFFQKSGVKLFDIVARDGERTTYKTNTPMNRPWLNQPLVLITGPNTFSAGEGFAFIMQDQKRGKVIGTGTAGAANPGRSHGIDDSFSIVIPNGKVVAAVNGGNWEGKGVLPDMPFDKANVVETARVAAKVYASRKSNGNIKRSRRDDN